MPQKPPNVWATFARKFVTKTLKIAKSSHIGANCFFRQVCVVVWNGLNGQALGVVNNKVSNCIHRCWSNWTAGDWVLINYWRFDCWQVGLWHSVIWHFCLQWIDWHFIKSYVDLQCFKMKKANKTICARIAKFEMYSNVLFYVGAIFTSEPWGSLHLWPVYVSTQYSPD